MRKLPYIILSVFMFQGCSAIIHQSKVINTDLKFKKLIAGTPRSEIIKTFGNPKSVEGNYIDFYKVCLPHESGAMGHIALDVLTYGLWEIVAAPVEAFTDCNSEDMVLVFDKNEKLKEVYKKNYYDSLVKIIQAIQDKLCDCLKNKNMVLICKDSENGWLFAKKDEVLCNYQDKFIKIYGIEIPSLKKVIEFDDTLEFNEIPIIINKVITIDNSNELFEIHSIMLYNAKGVYLNFIRGQDWTDINSASYAKTIENSIMNFCNNGNFNEYQTNQEPQIIDFLLDL